MEVGIEYIRNTNKRDTKFIMTVQATKFIMEGEFLKKVVVSAFKRTKDFSLSVMKQVRIFFPNYVPFCIMILIIRLFSQPYLFILHAVTSFLLSFFSRRSFSLSLKKLQREKKMETIGTVCVSILRLRGLRP